MLYTIKESGSDWASAKIRDTRTMKDLNDKLEWLKFSQIEWIDNWDNGV